MADLHVEDKKSKKINQKISHSNGGGGLVVVGGALVFGAILIGFMNRRSKERRRPNNKGVEDLSKIISEKINCKKEEDMQGLRSLLQTPSPSKICGEEEESKNCFMNVENLILGEGFVSKIDGKEEQFTCVNLERDSDSWRTLSAGDDCEKNEDVVVVDLAGCSFNSPQQDCIKVVDDDVEAHMDSASVKTIPVIEDVTESSEEMDVTHVGEGTVEDYPSIQILEEEEGEEEEYVEEEDEEEEEEEESVEQKGEEGSDGMEVSSTESNPEAIWPAESIERSLGTKTAHVEISNENDEKEIEKAVIKEEVIGAIKEEYQKGRSEINGEEMMMMMMINNETEAAHIKISEEIDEDEAQKSLIKEEENKEYQKGRSEIAEEEIMMIYNEKKAVRIKISDENDKEEAEKAIMKEEKVEIKEEDQRGRSEIAEEEMMMRNKEMKAAHIEISKENDEEDEMAVIKEGGEKGGSEIEAEEMMMMMMNKTNENEKGFRIVQVHQMHSYLVSRFWLMSTLVGLMLLLLSHLVVKLHYELYDESSSHAI